MIAAAAGAHRVLLERAQRRRRLAGIEHRDTAIGRVDKRRVSVAIPERRWRKLSAVRSAVSISAAAPADLGGDGTCLQRSPS